MQGALRACYSRLYVGGDNQGGYGIGAVFSILFTVQDSVHSPFYFLSTASCL
jgi:hypothetical protein